MRQFELPRQESEYFVPQGGQDIVSPPLLLANGVAFDAVNWQCSLEAGYVSSPGYDRFVSGKTPSEMVLRVAILSVTSGSIISGETLTGVTSGATLILGVCVEGASPQQITAGMTGIAVYVSDVRGRFVVGEALERNAALTDATVYLETLPAYPVEGTALEVEQARATAEAAMRAYMDKPGSGAFTASLLNAGLTAGPILGCFVLNDIAYVVRAKNPALTLSSDTPAVFVRAATPTDAVNRYWEVATEQPLIPTDGAKFEFVSSNFAAPASAPVIFGVSGTYKAFWYSGSTFGFITSGMTDDRPSHICIHSDRIWLSFKGSLQYSSVKSSSVTPAFPHVSWSSTENLAGEISMGSDITGLLSITGSENNTALLVSTKDRLFIVYGLADGSFKVVPFSANTGALPGTIQWIGQPVMQNIFGLTALSTSDRFGGFVESTISGPVKPFMDERRGRATASMICRDKNQYRVFFDDGTALFVTFRDGKVIGMFKQKFRHQVTCAWSCVLTDNTELMLIGTQDGGLYKLDVGTSFAGLTIPHHLRLAYNHFKSPRLLKHFKRSIVEASSEGYAHMLIGYDLDYGNNQRGVTDNAPVEAPDFEGGGFWDSGTWDVGHWDAATKVPIRVDTPGSGANLSLRFSGNDAISRPVNITGVTIDYTLRKALK